MGNYFEDLCKKLVFFVDSANKMNAVPVCSGDFFDTPSVPDVVKTQLIGILKNLWTPLITVTGNHDRLYGSDERFTRTSLSVMAEAGVLEILNNTVREYPDCYLVPIGPGFPLIPRDKPQLALGHGFFNQVDGLNTIMIQDLQSDGDNVVILGHDHCYYPPHLYRNTWVLRPGSFARGVRNDSADRIPIMVLVEPAGEQRFKEIPIDVASPVELIFRGKVSVIKKSEVSYEALIEQIKTTALEELSLKNLLDTVADEETVGYVMNTLNQIQLKKSK